MSQGSCSLFQLFLLLSFLPIMKLVTRSRCVALHLDGRSRYLKENPRPRGTVKVHPLKKSASGNAVTLAKEWEIPRQIPIMSTFFFSLQKATKKKEKQDQQQQMERKNRKKAEKIPLRLFSLRRYPLRVLLTTQILYMYQNVIYTAGKSFSVVMWSWFFKWKTLGLPIWRLELIISKN